jgi:hypothetical protein
MEGQKLLIVAVFSILALSMFSASASAEGFLSDIFRTIQQWFAMSPFGNLFPQQEQARVAEVSLTFFPESFRTEIDSPVNITANSTNILNFKGELNIILTNESKVVILREKGSDLIVEQKVDTIVIKDVKIPTMELKNTRLILISGNWTETSDTGVLKINDFLGTMTVRKNLVELKGNISKFEKL